MNTDDPHLKCHLMSQIILHICPRHHVVVLNLRCRRSCHNANENLSNYGYSERPSSGSISTVSGHLFHCSHAHRQQAFRPLSTRQPHRRLDQVRVALSPKERATFKSFRSDRDCVTRRFFGVWPVRFPNRYTRSSRGRATSSPSNHAW